MLSDLFLDKVDLLALLSRGDNLVDHVLIDCARGLEGKNSLASDNMRVLLNLLLELFAGSFDIFDEALTGFA